MNNIYADILHVILTKTIIPYKILNHMWFFDSLILNIGICPAFINIQHVM